jgi:hypothetical protein
MLVEYRLICRNDEDNLPQYVSALFGHKHLRAGRRYTGRIDYQQKHYEREMNAWISERPDEFNLKITTVQSEWEEGVEKDD